MRKLMIKSLVSLLLLTACATLTACFNTTPTHIHEYDSVVVAPKCTETGYTTHTCSCGDTYKDDYKRATGHSYGAPTYVWDGNICTATRVCQSDASHVETETVVGVYVTDKSATCLTLEKGHYKATFTNPVFGEQSTQRESVEVGEYAPHKFVDYVSDGNATCTENGTKTALCQYGCGEQHTITNYGSKIGHDYGTPTYTWDGEYCTASRVCLNDADHVESETVQGVFVKDTDANCFVPQKGHYKVTFQNPVFVKQTTEANSVEYGKPLDHDFEWIVDVPATKLKTGVMHEECARCGATRNEGTVIPESNCEHGSLQKTAGKEPTCTQKGTKEYWYCPDCHKYFGDIDCQIEVTNTLDEWKIVAEKGHNYDTIFYVWGGKFCTATRICRNDVNHMESETAEGVYVKDTDATCTEPEKGHYRVVFLNTAFTEQTTETDSVANGDPLGHHFEWVVDRVATTEAEGVMHEKCTRCDETRSEGTVIPKKECEHYSAQKISGTDPTCTEKGTKEYWYCSDCEKYYEDETCQIAITGNLDEWKVIPETGHKFRAPSYVWEGDTCTARRVCENDGNHVETETVKGVYEKDTDATCGSAETGHYKAVFTNPAFTDQTTETDGVEYGDPLGHDFEWIVDTPATKDTEGVKHEKCTRCDETRNEGTVIPKRECDHGSVQKIDGKKPTCTEEGTKEYWHCSDCDKYYTDEDCQIEITGNIDEWKVIPETGHDYFTEYVWEGKFCTATRICKHDASHVETETVEGVYVKDTEATATEGEKGHYKATFENTAFIDQTTAIGTARIEVPASDDTETPVVEEERG